MLNAEQHFVSISGVDPYSTCVLDRVTSKRNSNTEGRPSSLMLDKSHDLRLGPSREKFPYRSRIELSERVQKDAGSDGELGDVSVSISLMFRQPKCLTVFWSDGAQADGSASDEERFRKPNVHSLRDRGYVDYALFMYSPLTAADYSELIVKPKQEVNWFPGWNNQASGVVGVK